LLAATKFPYISALAGIFVTSDDNIVIARVLRAMKQLLKLVSDSEMDCTVNNVLQMFLAVGQDYISKHGSDDGSTPGTLNLRCPSSDHSRRKRNPSIDSTSLSEDILLGIESNQIPFSLLCSSTDVGESDDFVGCSEHRGLLALDFCFDFIKNNTSRVNKAWPTFVKSLCMLRDIRALPKSLSDLDDFADSSGHVLPLSSFALGSQKRFQDHHRAMNDKENPKQKGWFRSLFRKSKIDDQVSDTEFVVSSETDLSASAKALLEIVQASDVESIVQMGSSKIPEESIGALLDILDLYPFEHDPVAEQHAIFTVELAARALLSHHERAEALFLMFLSKFEKILCKATNVDGDTPDVPFIVERIVVTILRSCIHLYEFPKVSRSALLGRTMQYS
jgi:brefeldin A-resistance guanine nucleotide exchange factor 1